MTALELKVNQFLYELQRSGIVNMFGAAPYIVDAFDVTEKQARVLLAAWMRGWNEVDAGLADYETDGRAS